MGRGAKWRADAGVDLTQLDPNMARQMIAGYLSPEHLGDLDGQCPMIALPSDIARANPEVQASYQELLEAMVWLFESGLEGQGDQARQKAWARAALGVGGMILARSLPASDLVEEVRQAALRTATEMTAEFV